MIKTCVAYCRVSSIHDTQLNSLDNQKLYYMEKFAQEGYKPAKVGALCRKDGTSEPLQAIFADEGISGTSLKNRLAFDAMLQQAKNGAFNLIYVKNISRWARSVEDFSKTLKDLKGWGVEVRFEDGNLSSLDGAHEITLNLLASVAQEESRNKSVAVKFGIRRAQLAGKFTSQCCYGYNIEDGYLKINANEADVIKMIYHLYLDNNYGISKICRTLNEQGIPTKKGCQWSQHQIDTILNNALYTGKQTCHKVESFDVNRHTRIDVDPDEWIVHDMPHLRIIEDIYFSEVKRERAKRVAKLAEGYRQSTGHLFSNLVYCANCGGNLKRKKRRTYAGRDIGFEFTCQINDMYGKSRCAHRNAITEDNLLELVRAKVRLLQSYNMDDFFAIYNHLEFTFETSTAHSEELHLQAKKLKHKIDVNFELFSDGDIPKTEYKERNIVLRGELANIQDELYKIANIDSAKIQARLQFEQFKEKLQEVDMLNLTNQVLRRIFKRITIATLKPANSKKTFKNVHYDYQFLTLSVDEMVQAMCNNKGGMGAVRVDVYTDDIFGDIISPWND